MVREQAALMRLGLRFIREHKCEQQWVGRVPTDDEIDEWEFKEVTRGAVGEVCRALAERCFDGYSHRK